MGLGLSAGSGSGGNYNAICKYNAKAGRLYRIDRTEDGGNYSNDEVEITQGFSAVMDLANIEVGYAKFVAGQAPDFRLVKMGNALPARPDDKGVDGKPLYKQGFRVMMKLGKSSGGDIRELAATAGSVIQAMDALHTAYEAAPESKKHMLPVVTMPRTVKTDVKGSSNYAPVFEISKWVERPADLGTGEQAPSAPAAVTPAPKPASKHVEPPAPVAEPVAAGDDDW